MDKIGAELSLSVTVDKTNVASAVGSGGVDVFATPMMIALMEMAAAKCMQQFLDESDSSVGAVVNVAHTAATPLGMKVTATAKVMKVDGRMWEFDVVAVDEAGEIGRGTHTRAVINLEKFMSKVAQKAKS